MIPVVVFWVITSCIFIGWHQHFGGRYGHYPLSALKTGAKALKFVRDTGNYYQTTSWQTQ
jgi:hypothetical protein